MVRLPESQGHTRYVFSSPRAAWAEAPLFLSRTRAISRGTTWGLASFWSLVSSLPTPHASQVAPNTPEICARSSPAGGGVIPDATCYPHSGALRTGACVLSVFPRTCQVQGTEASPGSRPQGPTPCVACGGRTTLSDWTKWVQRLSAPRSGRLAAGQVWPQSSSTRPLRTRSQTTTSQRPQAET